MKKNILSIAVLYLTIFGATAQLSGSYTLGDPGSDYPDFQSALNDLYTQGVGGATFFEIQSGTYNETVFIDQQINFINGVVPIQFRSSSGNASDVILTPSGQYNVVFLEQTAITFRNVTLTSNNSAVNNVWFQETDACGIIGCVLNGDAATSRSVYTRNSFVTIVEGCTLNGGGLAQEGIYDNNSVESEYTQNNIANYNTFSIRMVFTQGSDVSLNVINGSSIARAGISMLATNNVAINNNTVLNHREQGITMRDDRFSSVLGNNISSGAIGSFGYIGIMSHQPLGKVTIGGNTINCSHPTLNRGIDLLSSGLRSGNQVLVFNNMISVGNGTSSNTGLGIRQQVANVDLFHNSVLIRTDNAATFSAAYFVEGEPSADDNLDVRNNIFYNEGGGYAYYYSESAPIKYRSDLNDIYSNSATFGFHNAITSDLSSLIALSGNDQNSISVNPLYTSQADLHVAEPFLHIGNLTSGITFDIDANFRGDGQVTIGADELYPGFEIDAGFEKTVYLGYAPLACADLIAIPSGGVAPYTYSWNTGDVGSNVQVCPSSTRKYYVKGVDVNGDFAVGIVTVIVKDVRCGNNLNKVQLCKNGNDFCLPESAATALLNQGAMLGSCPSNIAVSQNVSIRTFPNPFNSELRINFSEVDKLTSFVIYNQEGKLIHQVVPKNRSIEIETSNWSNGLYFGKYGSAMIKIVK